MSQLRAASHVPGSRLANLQGALEVLDSLELRWFFDNEDVPAQAFFAETAPEPSRVDDYLETGRSDLGFKGRGEGTKVETKYLLGSLGVVQLLPGVTGKLERWRKLSLTVDDAELEKSGDWLHVEKVRRLRRYAFDGGKASEVSPSAYPAAGCSVEFTALCCRAAGAPELHAWTLGFEAFGSRAWLLGVLQATCRAALDAGLRVNSGPTSSMSYPEWLFNRRTWQDAGASAR